MTRKQKGEILKRKRRWHRGLGLLLSLPLLLLAFTGILLHHGETLQLSNLHISNRLLLWWYAMEPTKPPQTLHAHEQWVTNIDGSLYLNNTYILSNMQSLTGIVSLESYLAVSSKDAIYLIDSSSNELVEKLRAESLPPGEIKQIALHENELLLETSSGIFRFNQELTHYSPHASVKLPSPHYQSPPPALFTQILNDWRGQGIHLERLLLDIHTGRIFGTLGVYFLDLVGISTLILVFSGLSLWWRIPR